jgi:prepilin-type N-terminal cleavage/methylation domain-containing protein/prepilin-type processing-associated H-X9-DG protein
MTSYSIKVKSRHFGRAFTLVELLVVIAIIAALASLGFVAARGVYQKSKATKTTSNLRQIHIAITTIQEDGVENGWNRRGTFPPYAGQIIDDYGWREFTIYELIGEQIEVCEPKAGGYTWKNHPKDTILQNPLSKHIFAGDTPNSSNIQKSSFGLGGYCYNAHLEGWVAPQSSESTVKRTRHSDLADSSRTILMAEMNDNGGKIWTGWGGPAAPHGNYRDGAHCLFVDGHVEHLKNEFLASQEGWQTHMQITSKY